MPPVCEVNDVLDFSKGGGAHREPVEPVSELRMLIGDVQLQRSWVSASSAYARSSSA